MSEETPEQIDKESRRIRIFEKSLAGGLMVFVALGIVGVIPAPLVHQKPAPGTTQPSQNPDPEKNHTKAEVLGKEVDGGRSFRLLNGIVITVPNIPDKIDPSRQRSREWSIENGQVVIPQPAEKISPDGLQEELGPEQTIVISGQEITGTIGNQRIDLPAAANDGDYQLILRGNGVSSTSLNFEGEAPQLDSIGSTSISVDMGSGELDIVSNGSVVFSNADLTQQSVTQSNQGSLPTN